MAGVQQIPLPAVPPPVPARPVRKSISTRVISVADLESIESLWTQLAESAIEPNPFFEPWMLIPAAKNAPNQKDLKFFLVFGPADAAGVEPLWGFFPLEITKECMHVPVRTLGIWQHRYCYLTVPLIERNHVTEVLDSFWRWFEQNPFQCRVLDTNWMLAQGRYHVEWTDFAIGRTALVLRDYPRAFLAFADTPGTVGGYLTQLMSKKHIDEYLRQERRLGEVGKLEYHEANSLEEIDLFVDEFLRLEAAGWKGGEDGAAYAKTPEDAAYFRMLAREGVAQNRVMLLSLVLDGKPIAMKMNLLSNAGCFAFRIAYGEGYSKYSPGVLLEIENLRRLFARPNIQFLDSCAKPRHPMAERMWWDRRLIRRTLFSDGSRVGDFWISMFPLLRWLRKFVSPQPVPAHLESLIKLADAAKTKGTE